MNEARAHPEAPVYQITVKGVLDEKWSDWFDGFTIVPLGREATVLTGPIRDQGALHGMLAKIRDLGLVLVSLQAVE